MTSFKVNFPAIAGIGCQFDAHEITVDLPDSWQFVGQDAFLGVLLAHCDQRHVDSIGTHIGIGDLFRRYLNMGFAGPWHGAIGRDEVVSRLVREIHDSSEWWAGDQPYLAYLRGRPRK